MRFLAWVFGGLLVAALLHVAMLSPEERAGILRVTPAPADATDMAAHAPHAVDGTAARGRIDPQRQPVEPDPEAAGPGAPGVETEASAGTALPPSPMGLAMPVQGVDPAELMPTFEEARAGGRVHEALDIMAPAGTPVLAVADGHVEKLFDSRQGGLTIYQFEPSGRHAYYYAHLERYAPGLAEGQAVRRGQVLGYVGSSGNADPAAPHLHFAIFALGPERRWWEGTPVDPYPLLAEPGLAR